MILLIGFGRNICYGQNLIVNGSFEYYTNPIDCSGGGFINYSTWPNNHVLNNWDAYNSPDYFNSVCNAGGFNVPNSYFGYNQAKSENAYVGLIAYPGVGNEVKEYIYQQLSSPLIGGKVYCLSFYVSLADVSKGAIKNVGAYFSNNLPSAVPGYINAVPQVENQNGFITDTVNWIEIQGCFTATGGEQYVTIGNFNSNANTDTLTVATNYTVTGSVPANYAYYYIDDITLAEDLSTGIIGTDNSLNKINLYPNPNSGSMQLDYDLDADNKATMKLYDVAGKLIKGYNLYGTRGSLQMNEQNLHNGIYFYRILVGDKIIKNDKIVIIK